MLEIKDLHVSIKTETENKPILKGVNLTIKPGEIHALMGPNATGKSTLGLALAGHPKYIVEKGEILLNGKNILNLQPNERANLGLFLAFQYPLEIPGVSFGNFLFTLFRNKNKKASITDFKKLLNESISKLNLQHNFAERQLNAGFSGGEKKRAEILQLLMLKPTVAILDETDSGLDIDSLKTVANALSSIRSNEFGCLLITHYSRILNYLTPDFVHVLIDGKIALTGNSNLPKELESKGYTWLKEKEEEILN